MHTLSKLAKLNNFKFHINLNSHSNPLIKQLTILISLPDNVYIILRIQYT